MAAITQRPAAVELTPPHSPASSKHHRFPGSGSSSPRATPPKRRSSRVTSGIHAEAARVRAITMAAAVSVGLREQQLPPVAMPVKFPQLAAEDSQEKLMEVLNEKPSSIASSSRQSLDRARRSFAKEDSSSSLSSRKSVDVPRAAPTSDYRRSKRISSPASPSYPPSSRHPSSNHRTYALSGGSSPQLVDTPLFGSTPPTPSALSKVADRHASSSSRRSVDGNGRHSARTSGDRSSADEGLPSRKQTSEDSSLGLDTTAGQHTRGVSMQKPKTDASEHPLLYHKLEMASLSTPELHLASDPMISTEEPTYRQRMSIQLLRSARTGAGSRERRTSTEVPRNAAQGGFASLTGMMDQVQSSLSNVGQRMRKDSNATRVPSSGSLTSAGGKGSERERKASAATIIRTTSTRRSKNVDVSVDGHGTTSSRGSIGTAPGTHKSKQKLSNNGLSNALSNASTWLKRPRRWSTQNGRAGPPAEARKASSADPQGSQLQVVKALSSETNGDSTVEGVDAQFDLAQAKQKLRAARQYLITELGKLEDNLSAQDKARVASLQWSGGDQVSDGQWADEQLHLWKALNDGVLLCLLADKFCPGSIEKIDRRDVEWVKADNISRFLKAARDELGLSSRDLFQCFDITDSTTEGLQRAVLTILALERGAPSSKSRRSGMYLQPRPTSLQRLNSSDLASRSSLDISFDTVAAESPGGSPARNGSVRSSSRLSVQQQRKEAERILVSGPQAEGAHDDNASAKSRRRRSVETQSGSYHRSITFADSVSNDDYFASGRLPYRDRKLSESAVSLTEVAEEEPEEIMNSPMPPRPPSPGISDIPAAPKSAPLPIPTAPPMARTSSQRRISMELQLGSASASTENLEELRTASPVRLTPHRRHSGVGRPTPSLLNPTRDLPASSSVIGGGASLPSPRLPFPRSASATSDSPSAKRLHRHLSLSGTTSVSEASIAANAVSSSPKLAPQRPAHHRFSSEFSSAYRVPLSPTIAKADSQSPALAFPRPRYDSEVTLGYNSTLASISTSEESPHLSRSNSQTPAPRHKLVVSEPGETPVTYQIGNRIGKGQFGSVYRALNLNTGQMMAVKRINLEGRSEEETTQLMQEVDLLKSLSHPSVVKYEGLVRETDALSIILEFVENGSLLTTLKSFGTFPEKLVATYVVKILEGLNYLHGEGVVHCDLKAANILTTKNGNIKLSDFGVSLNLKAVEKIKKDAVGTPNWMAPEVIELRGASTAADIWSLACTIIELLTGKPPYGDMMVMSAMFRIVVDDCPPIPEQASDRLKDLLRQCFRKEPVERPTAEQLFEHEWLDQVWQNQKDLRPQDSVPFLRRISADFRRLDASTFAPVPESPTSEWGPGSLPPSAGRPSFALRTASAPVVEHLSSSNELAPMPTTIAFPSPLSRPQLVLQSSDDELTAEQVHFADSTTIEHPDETVEPAKPHAFVKSSFSKPLQCRICREKVKKHAVLCEECGLLCHASCAGQAPMPCNLRAQLMLVSARPSADLSRGVSPAPSVTSSIPQSPSFSPINFRFPFMGKRRTSKEMDIKESDSMHSLGQPLMSSSPTTADLQSPLSPTSPDPNPFSPSSSKQSDSGSTKYERVRRFSLLPSRSTSSDSPASSDLPRASMNSTRSNNGRRQSSAFGSLSGSSSISSVSKGSMVRSGSAEKPVLSPVQPVTPTPAHIKSHVAMQSTPHLSMDIPRPVELEQEHRRRISTTAIHSFGSDRSKALHRGQMTPKTAADVGDASSRGKNDPKDCSVM